MYLNTIKVIYEKATANIILNCEKIKTFLLRSGTRRPTLADSIQQIIESPSQKNQERKRNKSYPHQKEKRKFVLVFRQ